MTTNLLPVFLINVLVYKLQIEFYQIVYLESPYLFLIKLQG